jgi:hypothetical protein
VSLQRPGSDYIGKSDSCGLDIWCRRGVVLPGEGAFILLEDLKLVLLPRRFDVLPSVKLGIDRPNSGSDHGDGGTQAD